jgi:hypothetical protein
MRNMSGKGIRDYTIARKFISGILLGLLAIFAAMGGALSINEKKVLIAELVKKVKTWRSSWRVFQPSPC